MKLEIGQNNFLCVHCVNCTGILCIICNNCRGEVVKNEGTMLGTMATTTSWGPRRRAFGLRAYGLVAGCVLSSYCWCTTNSGSL